jgi:hypothetical protein
MSGLLSAVGLSKSVLNHLTVSSKILSSKSWTSLKHLNGRNPIRCAGTISKLVHANVYSNQCIPTAAGRPPCRNFALTNMFLPRGEDGRPSRSVVESYTNNGFVVNGTQYPGAIVLLPEAALFWNVSSMDEVTWDSLIALRVLSPKPGKLSAALSTNRG